MITVLLLAREIPIVVSNTIRVPFAKLVHGAVAIKQR